MDLLKKTLSAFIILFCTVGSINQSLAETVAGCHCFKDRSFDPSQKFAADDYILATTFNSLTSRYFFIPKKDLVMLKMKGGIDSNDLLIGLKISQASEVSLSKILKMRKDKLSWQQILTDQQFSASIAKTALLKELQGGLASIAAGPKVADEMLMKFYGKTPKTIAEYRNAGLNEKEIALILILARTKKQNPAALIDQYVQEGKSWSEIANSVGVEPSEAGKMILK